MTPSIGEVKEVAAYLKKSRDKEEIAFDGDNFPLIYDNTPEGKMYKIILSLASAYVSGELVPVKAFHLVCDVIHMIETRGICLTSAEDNKWEEATAIVELLGEVDRPVEGGEKQYPCADCGKLRTKAEGGTTFTVCDECWDKSYGKKRKE